MLLGWCAWVVRLGGPLGWSAWVARLCADGVVMGWRLSDEVLGEEPLDPCGERTVPSFGEGVDHILNCVGIAPTKVRLREAALRRWLPQQAGRGLLRDRAPALGVQQGQRTLPKRAVRD